MVFLWVYVCVVPLGLCYSYVLLDLGIRLYRMDKERSASHKGAGRSCGGKIRFSPPPPINLAEDSATAGVQRYRDDGDRLGDGGVRGYRGGGDGLSDGGYIFGRPQGR